VTNPELPELSDELARRITLVRRDIGNLVFHFTRKPDGTFLEVRHPGGMTQTTPATASAVLHKILVEGHLRGSST
jgi:hypothetical protein